MAAELRADTSKLPDKTHPRPNITIKEVKVIKEMNSDKSRISLTVDKGMSMVVMDRQEHNTMTKGLLDHRDTYRPLPNHPTANIKVNLSTFSKTAKPRNKSTRILTKNFTTLVLPTQSSMAYPKSTNQAPPKTHNVQ